MDTDSWVKKCWESVVGRSLRGRQRKTWDEVIQGYLKTVQYME